MDIRFTGTEDAFLTDAFFDGAGTVFSIAGISDTSTQIVFRNTDTTYISTLTGFGFSRVGDTALGTITGMSFSLNGVQQAVVSGISWDLNDFFLGLAELQLFRSSTTMRQLFDQSNVLTLNASGALAGIDTDNLGNIVFSLTPPARNITGSNFDDRLEGALLADDTINAGSGNDTIRSSGGNDTIDGGTGTDTYAVLLGRDSYTIETVTGGGPPVWRAVRATDSAKHRVHRL